MSAPENREERGGEEWSQPRGATGTQPDRTEPDKLNVDELYRRYGGVVLRRIRRFFDAQQAEDVLQEVFARVIDKLHTFKGDSSPVTWLYQLTTRYCLNRLRNEGRRKELWLEHGDLSWSSPVSGADQEAKAALSQLWQRMDEDLVMIGLYYYVDGMTHAEISRVVGVSRRTIGNRIGQIEQMARDLSAGSK